MDRGKIELVKWLGSVEECERIVFCFMYFGIF